MDNKVLKQVLLLLCALMLFVTFIALGTWQVQRLQWKRALIERVTQRVDAAAVAAPQSSQWNKVSALSDEYRRVTVSGVLLDDQSTKVLASTTQGRGFWVMTPLRQANGSIVYINRGFIPYGAKACKSNTGNEVTGLLRMSEPGGTILRHNNPIQHQWYSRDIAALAASQHLSDVAPFFIDAEANNRTKQIATDCHEPIAGLTVIRFHNNHLIYAVTWYTLALMVLGGWIMLMRCSRSPQPHKR